MEYVVLGVQSWELEDEKTREIKKGISVHYLDPASPEDSEDSKGIFPAKLTAKTSLMDSFANLPGRYKFDISLKRTGGGKTGVELNSVEYVGSVSFDAPTNSSSTDSSEKFRPGMEAAKASIGAINNSKPKVSS